MTPNLANLVIGPEVVRWVTERTGEFGDYGLSVGFGWLNSENKLAGGVVFNEYNEASINMHCAGDGSGRWLARPLIAVVFDYAFMQARVKRITSMVALSNEKAIIFNERMGFEREAVLKDAHKTGDLVIFRMFKSQCRWLDEKYSRLCNP